MVSCKFSFGQAVLASASPGPVRPKTQLITFFFCQNFVRRYTKRWKTQEIEQLNSMLQFIIVSVYYIVVYRITQLFPSYCLSIRCHCQSGKRAEGIVVSALIYTLYARIIIRLLLNMDIKDISNCFFFSLLFIWCMWKENKTINAHFPFQLHATHTNTQIDSERCNGVPGVIGGQVLCSVGACTFFSSFFRCAYTLVYG